MQVELQAREQRLGQLTAQLAAEQQQVRRGWTQMFVFYDSGVCDTSERLLR